MLIYELWVSNLKEKENEKEKEKEKNKMKNMDTARVTVVAMSVCVCLCLSACPLSPLGFCSSYKWWHILSGQHVCALCIRKCAM